MNRRHVFFIFIALVFLLVALWGLYSNGRKTITPSANFLPVSQEQVATSDVKSVQTNLKSADEFAVTTEPPPYSVPLTERVAWWKEMGKKDWRFEYKMPISFFGKVVDDQGQPVAGASIEFSWMDLSSEGTSQKNATSDQGGLFSLSGVEGKSLTVFASKEGYKHYYSSNRFGFEYSVLASPDKHYTPDPMNPVVFVLRKDRDAEPLIEYSEKRAEVEQGQSKQFTIGPNGTTLLFERMTNDAPVRGGWTARVSVPGGGLVLTTEEFPYEAPEEGYEGLIEITNAIPKPPNWPSDSGAMLYFKTAQGYGRVMVRYISSMNRMFVTSWFNPNPDSRNLEIDPSKVEVIKP